MGYKSQVSYKSRLDLLSRLSCRCFRRLPGAFGDSPVLLATPGCIRRPERCIRRLSGAFGDSSVHSAPGRCIWRLRGAFGDYPVTSQFRCFPDVFLTLLELRIDNYQWLMPKAAFDLTRLNIQRLERHQSMMPWLHEFADRHSSCAVQPYLLYQTTSSVPCLSSAGYLWTCTMSPGVSDRMYPLATTGLTFFLIELRIIGFVVWCIFINIIWLLELFVF